MTTIYMQLSVAGKYSRATSKRRAITETIDLGEYITASDAELNAKLADMQARRVKPDEQVMCSYIGSIKQWTSASLRIKAV